MGARGRQGLSPDFDIYEMVRRQEREYDELLAAGTGSAGPVIRLQGAA
jgi:hypothetical protein